MTISTLIEEQSLKSWTLRIVFYILPVALKVSDLALTIYLLRFPWTYEANPIAFWIIEQGLSFSFVVTISLSVVLGVVLNHLFQRLFDPKIQKTVKILCGITLCLSYSMLIYPVVHNLVVADQINRWISQNV